MYVITLDTDWVPQFILDYSLQILSEYGIKATVFCTGEYDIFDNNLVEVAVHPNFMADSTQGSDEEEIIKGLRTSCPEAVGSRSHRLYWRKGLEVLLKMHGFRYDCSMKCFQKPGLKPVTKNGFTRIPVWWGDNFHLRQGYDLNRFQVPGMNDAGLKVLLFHPIHIYLNTANLEDYKELNWAARGWRHERDLASMRKSGPGTEKVFLEALGKVAREHGRGKFLRDIDEHVMMQ